MLAEEGISEIDSGGVWVLIYQNLLMLGWVGREVAVA
jgi:hypothetical protein